MPAGASLVLLETYEGEGGHLAELDLSIRLGEGAALERIVLADEDAGAVIVSRAEVALAPGSSFAQTVIASGARRQRLETRVSHPGGGAAARLDGIYLLADQRHADLTTVVTHEGMDGTTDQLTKGVVRDQARGVFQGRIVVSPGADKTDARMGHHALILSERAEVDAKPELEIFADDVACAHGNTVGALDEDALFYAEQRGIPEGRGEVDAHRSIRRRGRGPHPARGRARSGPRLGGGEAAAMITPPTRSSRRKPGPRQDARVARAPQGLDHEKHEKHERAAMASSYVRGRPPFVRAFRVFRGSPSAPACLGRGFRRDEREL